MSFMPLLMMAAAPLMQKMMGGGQDRMNKVPTMDKNQQQLFKKINDMISGGNLGQGYEGAIDQQRQLMDPNSAAVQQFTDPMMQQFEQQTVPGLAERFAGGGAMGGGLSSSGFGQALSSAGSNLQSNLAQLKGQLGQQAAGNLMGQFGNLSQQSLGAQPFAYQQQSPDLFSSMMQGWAQGGFGGMPGGGGGGGFNKNFGDWMVNNMPGGV